MALPFRLWFKTKNGHKFGHPIKVGVDSLSRARLYNIIKRKLDKEFNYILNFSNSNHITNFIKLFFTIIKFFFGDNTIIKLIDCDWYTIIVITMVVLITIYYFNILWKKNLCLSIIV